MIQDTQTVAQKLSTKIDKDLYNVFFDRLVCAGTKKVRDQAIHDLRSVKLLFWIIDKDHNKDIAAPRIITNTEFICQGLNKLQT